MDDFSPYPEKPVLVIGAAAFDILGKLRKDLLPGTSNQAHIRTAFGGVARNVAENLARLGQPVTFLTAVGKDYPGDRLLEALVAAGVNIDRVLRTADRPTGAYLGVLNQRGSLQLALDDMRAIRELTPEYIKEHAALFAESSALFVDTNLPKDTLRTAMSLARRARIPIVADPTAQGLALRLVPYLSRLALTTPNLAEAEVMCSQSLETPIRHDPVQAAKCLVSQGVKIAIITLAEQGVCYATSETSGQIPAIRTPIVDPTGAGDALTAAVMFALLNDIHLDDAVRLGVSAATLTLRNLGAVVPNLTLQRLYDEMPI